MCVRVCVRAWVACVRVCVRVWVACVCMCVYVNFIAVCNAIVGARVYVCVCACAWHEEQTTPRQYMRGACVIQEICVLYAKPHTARPYESYKNI